MTILGEQRARETKDALRSDAFYHFVRYNMRYYDGRTRSRYATTALRERAPRGRIPRCDDWSRETRDGATARCVDAGDAR